MSRRLVVDEATLRVVAVLVSSAGPLGETVRRARAGSAAYMGVDDMAAVLGSLDKALDDGEPLVPVDALRDARRTWGEEIRRLANVNSRATVFRLTVRDPAATRHPIIGRRDAAAVGRSLVHTAINEGLHQFAAVLGDDRRRAGLSLRAAAELARTSRARLGAWEAGRRSPTVWETVRWASAYHRRIELAPDGGANIHCGICQTPRDDRELARIVTGLHRQRIATSTSVRDLAVRLGIEERAIDLYESGVGDPPLHHALGAAHVLGMGIGLSEPSSQPEPTHSSRCGEDG